MRVLSFDPSGNFKEGKGTTGICQMVDGTPIILTDIHAGDFEFAEMYWAFHREYIRTFRPDFIVMEGYKLYNHKGTSAKMQANSELETPQLIGYLKMVCYEENIPLTIQFASDVKTRWSEDVLVRLGILEQKGTKYYFNGKSTVTHHRDALKHALHFERYKKEKL